MFTQVSSRWFNGRTAAVALALAGVLPAARAQEKVTYHDQLLPLIEQHCANCHNPDKKKGDLVLTSYNALLKGGGSGAIVASGNVEASKLWKAVTHAEEPTMPPNKPKLGDKDLEVFRQWIAGGLLESSGSKAVATAKPSVDLTLKLTNVGKPDGPPPMPKELPLEPVVHTKRGGAVSALAVSPWAPLVALAGQKQILLYNTTSLDLLGILPFAEGQPWDLKFSRSGKLLLAAGGHGAKSGRVVLWNIENGERVTTLGEEYDSVLAADISPDQSRVALGGPSRLVKIHSTKTGEVEHKMKKHTDWVTAVAFSPNGEWLATGDRNGGVVIWDADNGQELFTTLGHKSAVTALSWRDDSRLVASSSEDGSVKLWESTEGKQAKTWTPHASGAMAVAYSHDGKFATCGRDGAVTTWSADGTKLKGFDFTGDIALRCAFTHDGTRIVAADFSGRAAVWSTADGRKLGELDANPPLLAEQITIVQRRIDELTAPGVKASAPPPPEGPASAKAQEKLAKARAALEKAQKDFEGKAAAVARLKALSTQASPPAGVEQQLIAARAAREQARAATNTATLTLEARVKEAGGVKEKPAASRIDPAQELAAAKERLVRLTRAQAQGGVFRARENVAVKKRELEGFKVALAAKLDEIKSLTKSLDTAQDAAAKTKLKADLKTAAADVKAMETSLKKCSAELTTEQAKAEKAAADFERTKSASADGGTRAKL